MIYKRGSIYWAKFQHDGRMIYKSTGQTSATKARQVEARLRSELALGNFGILTRKTAPTLAEFCKKRFEPWAESTCSLKTWRDFYRVGLLAIEGYGPLAKLTLDAIGGEKIADFARYRQAQGLQISSVNSSLRILRRVLRLAEEWGELEKAPKIKMLPGERHRERVITPEEEARYLASANPLLAEVATVLGDTGMRPEECYALVWDSITWVNGRNGTLLVTRGKTKAARRMLPMTPRVRSLLEARWIAAGKPLEGYLWPALTMSGHIEPSSLKKQHAKAVKLSKVRPFVLYSLRHTFATRIAPHVDAWTLCKIMGWASLSVAMRYIHPSDERVLAAFANRELYGGGDKTGDSQQNVVNECAANLPLIAATTIT